MLPSSDKWRYSNGIALKGAIGKNRINRAIAQINVLVVFLFCISYVTNLALELQDFNKLTYFFLAYLLYNGS